MQIDALDAIRALQELPFDLELGLQQIQAHAGHQNKNIQGQADSRTRTAGARTAIPADELLERARELIR